MKLARIILKKILWFLAKVTIRKHQIEFIIFAGWFGTDLAREGLYELLSEKFNVRRNNQKVLSDLSVPLNILGYKDKRYSIIGWMGIIFRSIFSLILNKPNKHKFILSLNLAQKPTSEYWSSIIKPKILVITSYQSQKSTLIDGLISQTKLVNGSIIVSDQISTPKLNKFEKFGYKAEKNFQIITKNGVYNVNKKLPLLLLRVYAPIISVLEHYGWSKAEIIKSLDKVDSSKQILDKIVTKVKSE